MKLVGRSGVYTQVAALLVRPRLAVFLVTGLLSAAPGCGRRTARPAAPSPAAHSAQSPPPASIEPSPPPAPAPVPHQDAAAELDDIREAVFRHLFVHNASGAQGNAQFFCLQVEDEADPSAALLARFASSQPPVLAGSRCRFSANGVDAGGFDGLGLLFHIRSIAVDRPDHATVEGGYFEAGLSASGNVYVLERGSGGWRVVTDTMRWIS